ncbi:uncharacterized protein LOC143863480 isoform X2 [Tasmannia lanceolata]|uniref:uncharacterized protein LOC143863480 isoform X2 n=1 Tax=Tasmannia lanceolata TaxID=3420 RepID=UPI004063C931
MPLIRFFSVISSISPSTFSSRKIHESMSNDAPLNDSRRVLRFAIASRLLLLALILFWRSLFSPYDTSASLNPSCLSSNSSDSDSVLFPRIRSAIENSIVWDGVYFVRIAQCGYEYEQTYAFLPLLPICISLLSRTVFAPLIPVLGYRAVLGLSAYVLNNVGFLFAAVYFYRLSVLILKDADAAFRASILFCFNPASIFYSSVYSETLYALFSLGGVYHLLAGSNTIAMLLLALSGSARSNGVLNAGYFCFQALHQAYNAIFGKNYAYAVRVSILAAVRSLCIFVPFIAFQAYGYFNLCLGSLSDELRPWCKTRVPLFYDYLQSQYWGVGFLRYFQLKQLPNFLLASPILSLAVCSIIQYAKLRPAILSTLGFRASQEEKNIAAVLYHVRTDRRVKGVPISKKSFSPKALRVDLKLRQRKKAKEKESDSLQDPLPSDPSKQGYSSILVLPFILHLWFMAAVAFLFMHVQVATRFLSASPPLYWCASYLMVSPGKGKRGGYLIWTYCVAYILLGSLLFSNFYPLT